MGLLNQTAQNYYNGSSFGDYQFVSLTDIINQFMAVYVGEDKIIPKARRVDVAFHAQRALAELSFDTFKSFKAQEITVPATLQMILPQDYVNYTKISWVDSAGIKHLLYPTSKTSNPTNPYQDDNGIYNQTISATFTSGLTATLGDGEVNVVLDGIYHNIPVGSIISGPTIGTWTVIQNSLIGDNVALQFVDDLINQNYYIPTSSFTETLTVERLTPLLDINDVRTPAITGAPWVAGSNVITFDNAADTAGITIGMVVNYFPSFPAGTRVTGVNGRYVVVENNATTSPASSTDGLLFTLKINDSDTWASYKSSTPSENQDDYIDDTYWPMNGSRYGLDPQYAQANGSFYIDDISGKIHFSSNISGKTVILDYISDSLGTDGEMQVHKFAEEAMYRWIAHAIMAGRVNIPEYQVQRFKKEKFAAVRTAKLRLSNIKLEEITQILRGKSKQIKH
jgi:hypothetical protein